MPKHRRVCVARAVRSQAAGRPPRARLPAVRRPVIIFILPRAHIERIPARGRRAHRRARRALARERSGERGEVAEVRVVQLARVVDVRRDGARRAPGVGRAARLRVGGVEDAREVLCGGRGRVGGVAPEREALARRRGAGQPEGGRAAAAEAVHRSVQCRADEQEMKVRRAGRKRKRSPEDFSCAI